MWRLYGARINIFLFLIIYNYLFVINYYSIYVTNDRNDYLILIYFKIESEDISEIYLKKIIRSLESFRDLIHLEYICIIVHRMFFFSFLLRIMFICIWDLSIATVYLSMDK